MRRAAILCAGLAGLPMAASAQLQLEIRHHSHVEVAYEEVPFVGPYVQLEDTIVGVSAYEPFSLAHSVSYDDEYLDFDPTASSTFSVDSIEFVGFNGTSTTQAFYDVSISGELFRSGVGPVGQSQFSLAQPELTVDIVGFSGASFTAVSQYNLDASFTSNIDLSDYSSLPLLSIERVISDDQAEVLHTLEPTGSSASETFVGNVDPILGTALRIRAIADPYEILVKHDGITTVTFEGTFRVMTGLAPEPCLADVNGDGDVTPADFSAWVAAFNSGAPECDQNGDELCTPADFSAWVANFNAGCD